MQNIMSSGHNLVKIWKRELPVIEIYLIPSDEIIS